MFFLGSAGASPPAWVNDCQFCPLCPQQQCLAGLPWPACPLKSHRVLGQAFSTTFWGVSNSDLWVFSSNLVYTSYLVVAFHVHFTCWHLPPCYFFQNIYNCYHHTWNTMFDRCVLLWLKGRLIVWAGDHWRIQMWKCALLLLHFHTYIKQNVQKCTYIKQNSTQPELHMI